MDPTELRPGAFADRSSRRLARTIARAMARHGPKLERRQAILFRVVDIGAELYAMCAACVYASMKLKEDPQDLNRRNERDSF